MKFKNSVPVISTANVRSTIEWYSRVLGFREHFVFGDPPVYAGLEHDGVLLYVTHDPKAASALKESNSHPDIFLWVEGIDEAYENHRARGAKVIEPIADRPWDARQYVLEDPNGYHLKIAEPLDEIVPK
jgi:uncharacterized glyoxalase superfamily protein PhnB